MNDDIELSEYIPPKPVEYRLYYDSNGKVLFYTCDDESGDYILIDKETFVKGRPDVRVIDGKIVEHIQSVFINKLEIANTGVCCAIEDINIIVDTDYTGKTFYWENKTYEVKHG
jgi:hypothetical protein